MKKISVIIPTLNEEEGLREVLERMPWDELLAESYSLEVIVVDGGSSDGTVGVSEDYGVGLLVVEGGKAEAVRRGLEECSGEYVFTIDGDGSYPPEALVEMIGELEDGADMVLGSRFLGEMDDRAMNFKNRVGNKILTWLANRLYGTDVTDLCTGMRGFRRSEVDVGELDGSGFEIEASIHGSMAGGELSEVGIDYSERFGRSKLRTWDGIKIAWRLLADRF